MSEISRRTLAKSAVWAAPVVTLALNSPTFATSGIPDPPKVSPKGNRSHRQNGGGRNWDYHLEPGLQRGPLTVDSVVINGAEAVPPFGSEKRWTVYDVVDWERSVPVQILFSDGSVYAGIVRFS